jgi:membrane-associated phospholipid phosphatase
VTDPADLSLAAIRWLQQFSPALDLPMRLITLLGNDEFYLLLLPALYWLVSPALAVRLFLALATADALVNGLKQSLAQPRPYWVSDAVRGLTSLGDYGFPSGHAANPAVLWGSLARWLRRRWCTMVALAVVALIGLSRLYLGVHFLHDVLGGWALGLLVLALAGPVERRLTPWLGRQPLAAQLALATAASLGLLVVGAVARGVGPDPPAWPQATAARSAAPWITTAGALLGVLAGYALMRRYAPFAPARAWPHVLGRLLLGLIGLALAWRGLAALFGLLAADGTPLGDALRYLRYALMTLWATLGAPWLWLRLRLAMPPAPDEEGEWTSPPLRSS